MPLVYKLVCFAYYGMTIFLDVASTVEGRRLKITEGSLFLADKEGTVRRGRLTIFECIIVAGAIVFFMWPGWSSYVGVAILAACGVIHLWAWRHNKAVIRRWKQEHVGGTKR